VSTIPIQQLTSIPYLDLSSRGDRTIKLMPLWDGQQWRMWVPGPDRMIEIKPIEAVESDYVAKGPASQHDLLIPFVEFMWQRGSFPEICPMIRSISDDFHNLGTSVMKLRHFHNSRKTLSKRDVARFATTEIEYMLMLARTVFDQLQEAMSRLWHKRICYIDPDREKRRKAQRLPDTFSKMVLRDKQTLKTATEIEEQFGLPAPVAAEYAAHGFFFSQLRSARDAIVHGNSSIGTVFETERGFCVDPRAKPFSFFVEWTDAHRYNENLVSVLPWVASVVLKTIDACNKLILIAASVIEFPPEIAPGYRVFVRGPSTPALAEVLKVMQGGSSWWDENEASARDPS
jgi:hypothetical protein